MKQIDNVKTLEILQAIMEFELAGVVRYTHYSLLVTGLNKATIIDFLREQASESLTHAQRVGEMIVSVEGHPKPSIAPVDELTNYTIQDVLKASEAHEKQAMQMYQNLLDTIKENHSELKEFVHSMISEEGSHYLELEQMIRDASES
jgi:bacterioferritin